MRNNLISARELIFAAISSRLFVLAANIQNFGKITLFEIILSELFNYILIYIIFSLIKKKSFTKIKLIKYATALYLAVVIVSTAFALSYFTTNNLSYNYSYLLIPILVVLISIYLANNGIEGVSRFSLIAVFLVVLSLFFLIFASKDGLNTANYSYKAISLNRIFLNIAINFEVVLIFIFRDNTKSFSKVQLDSFNKASFFIPVISYIVFMGVFGNGVLENQDFPLMLMVDFASVMSRYNLSYLFTAILIVLAIARISFLLSSILKLSEVRKIGYVIPTIIVTVSVILFRKLLINQILNLYLYSVIPLILIITILFFSKKEGKR